MPTLPKSITITNTDLFIDGVKFPYYIAESGPEQAVRGGLYEVSTLSVPLLFIENGECIFTDLRS